MKKDLTSQLSSLVPHLKINEPLKNYTTYKIGGPAKYFADIFSKDELLKAWSFCIKQKIPFMILGAGSNVLAADQGFNGLVARLTGEFSLFTFKKNILKAGAGARLPVLVHKCMEKQLSGLEGLAGIPGTVGGALITNAGTKNGCIGSIVENVEILSNLGHILTLNKKDLKFFYRGSNLEGKIILSTTLNLKKAPKNDILTVINENLSWRSKTQPLDDFNAGSVFKNPENDSAGRLIDEAGLKGLKFGGAKISEKHANFIVNTGNAKASDVKSLISMARSKVKEKFGINLELEIKIIGEV